MKRFVPILVLACTATTARADFIETAVSCEGATEPVAIAYGQSTENCTVSPATDLDGFVFDGTAGELVRIILRTLTGNMDGRVEVRAPDQTVLLDVNCNGGFQGGTCSLAEEITLTLTGAHTIAVSDANSDEPGDYFLQIERIPALQLVNQPYGFSRTGTISPPTDHDFYSFPGLDGSTVRISVLSTMGNFDPRLEVWDPAGTRIFEGNCNGGFQGGTCSFETNIDIVLDGDYVFAISDANNDELGSFELSLQCLTFNCPPAGTAISASILPTSRSPGVGELATAFATIINGGEAVAADCSIVPTTTVDASFWFQAADVTNSLIGARGNPVDIPGFANQPFVFAFTANSVITPTDIEFEFDCINTEPAPSFVGVNSLLFSASTPPTPDVIALAATISNDGIAEINGAPGTGVFSVATANVGVMGNISVAADVAGAVLPLNLAICQTNPTSGACLDPPGASVTVSMAADATATFGVFLEGTGQVDFDPANNRVFVRFTDQLGAVRGATSVAVRTQE